MKIKSSEREKMIADRHLDSYEERTMKMEKRAKYKIFFLIIIDYKNNF